MSTRTKILIIVFGFILLAIIGAIIYVKTKNQVTGTNTTTSTLQQQGGFSTWLDAILPDSWSFSLA